MDDIKLKEDISNIKANSKQNERSLSGLWTLCYLVIACVFGCVWARDYITTKDLIAYTERVSKENAGWEWKIRLKKDGIVISSQSDTLWVTEHTLYVTKNTTGF